MPAVAAAAAAPDFRPLMAEAEQNCLQRHLDRSHGYVEFGSGGSTLLAVRSPVAAIHSVESSPQWIDLLRSHPEIAAAERRGRLRLCPVDIGAVGEYGHPVELDDAYRWPAYYRDVWDLADPSWTDLVLVDGRFRVACALSSLMRCRDSLTLIVHDFWNRPQYHDLLDFIDVVERVEKLGVFRPRKSIPWRAFAVAMQKHALDPE